VRVLGEPVTPILRSHVGIVFQEPSLDPLMTVDETMRLHARLFDVSADVVSRQFVTNAIGPLLVMQAVIPGMRERGYGRIVNVSSMLAQLKDMGGGYPGYRMSKVALNALTRVVASEVGPANIKVNAMSPGWVATDMGGPDATRTVVEGADTAVWLATLPDDGPTGGFFDSRKQVAW
jgi:NAD(P)-dependent dehydrogenase (short-subunit alcohol dehydrogenase family)